MFWPLKIVIYFCFVGLLPTVQAQTLTIDRVTYVEDEKGDLLPHAALQALDQRGVIFQGIPEQYSDSRHWFRIDGHAAVNSQPQDLLHVRNTLIASIKLWSLLNEQLEPFVQSPLPHHYPVYPLSVKSGQRFSLLIQLNLTDQTALQFEMHPPVITAYEHPLGTLIVGLILAGFAVGLLIYNFVMYLFLREPDLINFSIYSLTLITMTSGYSGAFTLLGLPIASNSLIGPLAGIALAAGIKFGRGFLDIKSASPIMDRILLFGQYLNIGCAMCLLAGASRKIQYLLDISLVVGVIVLMSFSFYVWRKGLREAKQYIFAWSAFVPGIIITLGLIYDLVPRTILTENALIFALDIQLVVLSGAIGEKIGKLRSDLLSRLQDANSELEQKVEQRTRTVMEQQQALIQTAKMASLGEMAGGIAHEINNPLMILSGYTEHLASMIKSGQLTSEKALMFQARMQKASDRIRNIVTGLQTISRESSQDQMKICVLSELLKDTRTLCERRFASHGVELRLQQPAHEINFLGHPSQICQILLNLLNNAFDAVEHRELAWVEIQTEETWDKICLRVIDSGPGIAPELAQRIFDPFFTTKEVGRGTGLGLSISKSLLQLQGGHIFVDHAHPHTCFVVELAKPAARLSQTAS